MESKLAIPLYEVTLELKRILSTLWFLSVTVINIAFHSPLQACF